MPLPGSHKRAPPSCDDAATGGRRHKEANADSLSAALSLFFIGSSGRV
jgi:hypothetical protein